MYNIENDSLVPLDATKHWLYIRHKFYRSIPLPGAVKESSPVLRLILHALEIRGKREIKREGPVEQARSGEKIRLALEEMERLAQVHGFQVAYVLIAPQALYLREQDPTLWGQDFLITEYQQLRPIIARQARFVDAWFGDTELHVCGSQLKTPAWPALFADDGRDHNRFGSRHFNENGYSLLANIVATCLLSDAP